MESYHVRSIQCWYKILVEDVLSTRDSIFQDWDPITMYHNKVHEAWSFISVLQMLRMHRTDLRRPLMN